MANRESALLLMLTGAARGVFGIHGVGIRAAALFALTAKFLLGLEPVVHVAAVGAAFTLKNLVGACGDFFAAENAGAVSDGVVAITGVA